MAKTRVAPDPNLGKNIATLMEQSEDLKSQSVLAKKTGIAQSTIGRILRAESNATSGNVAAIARAFGVDVGQLYMEHAAFTAALEGKSKASALPSAGFQAYAVRNIRPVFVCGTCQGGLPEVIHEGWLAETAQEYAEVSTTDEKAFVCRVVGDSMVPRYMPGEYALVEPGTGADVEDDVLVRLATGETMLKRLLSRRGGIRLGSYNDPATINLRDDEVSWIYYVAHPVPAKKIKQRTDLQPLYSGPERRAKEVPVEVDLRTRGWHYDTEGRDPPARTSIAEQIAKKRNAA